MKEREILKIAFDLSKYAAAPLVMEDRVDVIPRTTSEWWDGLRDQIEAIQPVLQAALSAAPTPPEVEPILWIDPNNLTAALKQEKGALRYVMRAPEQDHDIPLYTSPPAPNDELRVAAELAANVLARLGYDTIAKDLRSALNKKEGE